MHTDYIGLDFKPLWILSCPLYAKKNLNNLLQYEWDRISTH